MEVFMRKYGLLLVALFVVIALPLLADDFSDLKKQIRDALNSTSMTSAEKANLIRQLAQYPSADSVKLCFRVIKDPDRAAKKLERERDSVKAQLEKLRKDKEKFLESRKGADGKIRFTAADQQRYNEYLDKEKKLNQSIADYEDKIRAGTVAKNSAVYVLSQMTSQDARDEMLKGLQDSDWRIVYACVEAFMKQKWAGAFDAIAELYPVDGKPHKNPQVRAKVIMALKQIAPDKGKKIFIKALEDNNWIVRSKAVRALGEIADKDCVGPLIKALENEDGRLKWDIITVLKNITGKDFRDNVSNWRAWWAANKNSFEPKVTGADAFKENPKNEGSHETGAFYGIPITSNRPIFIIDQSGSMTSAADTNLAMKQAQDWMKQHPGAQGIPPIPPPAGHLSKWQVLQRELVKSIKALKEKKSSFNIVWYFTGVELYSKKMVKVTKSNVKRAEKEIMSRKPKEGEECLTNIHDGMKKAFEIATGVKKGSEASVWTNDKGQLFADTFFFMTDGYPTAGPVQDMDKIREKIREWNKTLGIKINCVGVGIDNRFKSYNFLKQIAAENKGKFVCHNTEK